MVLFPHILASSIFNLQIYFFNVYECLICMYVRVAHACLGPALESLLPISCCCISLYSETGSHYVNRCGLELPVSKVGLKLVAILLLQASKARVICMSYQAQFLCPFLKPTVSFLAKLLELLMYFRY